MFRGVVPTQNDSIFFGIFWNSTEISPSPAYIPMVGSRCMAYIPIRVRILSPPRFRLVLLFNKKPFFLKLNLETKAKNEQPKQV